MMNSDSPTFIDAHHHLWDLQACHYPWLMAQGVKRFFGDPTPIQKNYLPADFLSESRYFIPEKSVHIQVGVAEDQSVDETLWVEEQAKHSNGVASAIVAFTNLCAPDLDAQLDAHARAKNLRGIRQIIGRHPDEDKQHGTDALLDDEGFLRGLRTLGTRGLSFDLQIIAPQLDRAAGLFAEVPELSVALCHCGSPWDQSRKGISRWRNGLAKMAALPNTRCKISGLGMFNPEWTEATLRPLILSCIEVFSPERCMFGSNFPVDKLYRSYDELWETYFSVAGECTEMERAALFSGCARKFYRLEA